MTAAAIKTITISREHLYNQVWKTPMRTLAHQYGLSDVGLSKVCERHDIPKPPVGYWAKKQVGKAPPQTPLPTNADPTIQSIRLWDGPRPEPVSEPPQEYDPDIQEMLGKAMALPPVKVATTLHNLHPLVRDARTALEETTREDHGLISSFRRDTPVVEITVAKANFRRAVLFMDSLFKGIESVGGTIAIAKPSNWQPEVAIVRFAEMVIGGVRLRERYKQVQRPENSKDRWSYPRHDCRPTGRLVLDHAPSSYEKPFCEDGEKLERSIETKINKVIIKWVNQAGMDRIRRRKEEEERRVRAEQERIRQEKEAELKRRTDALILRQKQEQSRVDRLVHEAESWQKSQMLRAYIAAMDGLLAKRPEPPAADSEALTWIRWAHEQADRLDPLSPSPPSILDRKADDIT